MLKETRVLIYTIFGLIGTYFITNYVNLLVPLEPLDAYYMFCGIIAYYILLRTD